MRQDSQIHTEAGGSGEAQAMGPGPLRATGVGRGLTARPLGYKGSYSVTAADGGVVRAAEHPGS